MVLGISFIFFALNAILLIFNLHLDLPTHLLHNILKCTTFTCHDIVDSNTVYKEIFAPFNFHPFHPHCPWMNLRLDKIPMSQMLSLFLFKCNFPRRCQDGAKLFASVEG